MFSPAAVDFTDSLSRRWIAQGTAVHAIMHGMLLQVMAASGSIAAAQNHGSQRRSQAEDVDWKHLQVHQCPAAHMISLVLDTRCPMQGCAFLCYA